MYLELHDGETGKTLTAKIQELDYDYQAEQWVQDTYSDPHAKDVVKWELHDNKGLRCVWERPANSSATPNITQRSPRFQGTWEKGPSEVTLPN